MEAAPKRGTRLPSPYLCSHRTSTVLVLMRQLSSSGTIAAPCNANPRGAPMAHAGGPRGRVHRSTSSRLAGVTSPVLQVPPRATLADPRTVSPFEIGETPSRQSRRCPKGAPQLAVRASYPVPSRSSAPESSRIIKSAPRRPVAPNLANPRVAERLATRGVAHCCIAESQKSAPDSSRKSAGDWVPFDKAIVSEGRLSFRAPRLGTVR